MPPRGLPTYHSLRGCSPVPGQVLASSAWPVPCVVPPAPGWAGSLRKAQRKPSHTARPQEGPGPGATQLSCSLQPPQAPGLAQSPEKRHVPGQGVHGALPTPNHICLIPQPWKAQRLPDVGRPRGPSSFSSCPVIILGRVYLTFCFGWRRDGPGKSVWLPSIKTQQPTHHARTPTQRSSPSTIQKDTSGPLLAGAGPRGPGRAAWCGAPTHAPAEHAALPARHGQGQVLGDHDSLSGPPDHRPFKKGEGLQGRPEAQRLHSTPPAEAPPWLPGERRDLRWVHTPQQRSLFSGTWCVLEPPGS